MKHKIINYFYQFATPLLILCIWAVCTHYHWVNTFLVPTPHAVWTSFWTMSREGVLWQNIAMSMGRVFCGFGLALIVGITCAFLFYFFPILAQSQQGLFNFIQNIPPLAMLSLLVLWFGIGEQSKIVMIFLAGFFPIFINTYNGLRYCDPKWLELGLVRKMTKKQLFQKILFPSTMPYMMMGSKISLTYAWRSLIGAEFIATNRGLGYMILDARELARPDIIMMGLFCLGIIGIMIDQLFLLMIKKNPYLNYRAYHE